MTTQLFQHLDEVDIKGLKTFLFFRISTRQQQTDLPAQIVYVLGKARAAGAIIIGAKVWVGKGSHKEIHEMLSVLAKDAQIILSESLCRFVRHPDWRPRGTYIYPTQEQLQSIMSLHFDKKLLTCFPLDIHPRDIRSRQILRGKEYGEYGKDTKYKIKGYLQRNGKVWQAMEMRINGRSIRRIAMDLNISEQTVSNWLRRYRIVPDFSIHGDSRLKKEIVTHGMDPTQG